MSRVTDIISNVRTSIADKDKNRWSDDDLMLFLNRGIEEICQIAKAYKIKTYLAIQSGISTYDLRDTFYTFTRIEYNDIEVDKKTTKELFRLDSSWKTAVGSDIKFITFDNLPIGVFRIYPIIEDTISPITQNSLYGGLIDITTSDDVINAANLEDLPTSATKYLTCYGLGKHTKLTITSIDEDFKLDSIFDNKLVDFITGKCFETDSDSFN
jgi:hypothetical protein